MNRNLESSLEQKRDRRGLLALIGGGGAAAIAGIFAQRDGTAQAHGPSHVESASEDPAIHGNNTANGPGVEGTGNTGPGGLFEGNTNGLEAFSNSTDPFSSAGVFFNPNGCGVGANSENFIGVLAAGKPAIIGECMDPSKAAVVGASEISGVDCSPDEPCSRPGDGIGVRGITAAGAGVEGVSLDQSEQIHGGDISFLFPLEGPLAASGSGIGVLGRSGSGTGLRGESASGLALDVAGKARFSTAGSSTVPQGQNSVFVANAAVTADSHVSVTLAGNPGARQLHYVSRSPGAGFTLNLTSAPPPQRPQTPFTYLIVEPG
jgi:hypothetical protein